MFDIMDVNMRQHATALIHIHAAPHVWPQLATRNPPSATPLLPALSDSEHDENLTLTSPEEKKLKITNYPRFAIT